MRNAVRHIGWIPVLVAFTVPAQAQPAPSPLWYRQFGEPLEYESSYFAAADAQGGAYIGGVVLGEFGGPGFGSVDSYIARYDGAGNQVWVRRFGSPSRDSMYNASSDGAGGVYISGLTEGSFGCPSGGSADPLLVRFDQNGTLMWARQLPTAGYDVGTAVAPDGAGGALWTGSVNGTVFLTRYSGQGDQLWIRNFGIAPGDDLWAAQPDGEGGVYLAGATTGSLGGPNAGIQDAWIARYTGAGDRLWIVQFGTYTSESITALAPDGAGGVYLAGGTYGPLGGPAGGNSDAFIARCSGDGELRWIRQFGTPTIEDIRALATDESGGVYAAGSTRGSLGGPNAGREDGFLARYDIHGNRTWITQYAGAPTEDFYGLAVDGQRGVFVAGCTEDPNASPWPIPPDPFILRYPGACYPNCDGSAISPILNVADFTCFLQKFAGAEPYANCDNSASVPVLNIHDFTCFLQRYAAGCP